MLQDSESEDETEIVLQDSDNDQNWWEEEDDENWRPLTNDMVIQNVLNRQLQEGDFVIVIFPGKKQNVFFVAKILNLRNQDLEYYVSFLRLKNNSVDLFHFPTVPDVSYVKEDDIKMILPKPRLCGSTIRQQSYFQFAVNFSELNIR